MDKLHWKSATEIARLIREKKHRQRCVEHFPRGPLQSEAQRHHLADRPRVKRSVDASPRGQVWGPLHGVPMTIKESYNVAGSPTTWGDPALKDNVTKGSALSVERLEKAGVVLFGKTNVPLMLAD